MKCKVVLTLICAVLLLCSCGEQGSEHYIDNTSVNTVTSSENTQIKMNVDNVEVTGAGASFANGTLHITLPGKYTLTGTLDGGVIVELSKKESAEIILNGVDINPNDTAAIYVKSADSVTVTLADGTDNIVSDAGDYALAENAEPSACIYSADDLTISGSGHLTMYANSCNGIQTKNDLVIEKASLDISAAKNAIKGKDSVTISSGFVKVLVCKDGIKSDNKSETGKGKVLISGGEIDLSCQDDGIQATLSVDITGGKIKINANDKKINCDKAVNIKDGCMEEETSEVTTQQ